MNSIDEIIKTILANRSIITPKEIDYFLSPIPPQNLDSPWDSKPAIDLINHHLSKQSTIVIFGDYDVDGVCSTAILWETLSSFSKNITPHIPDRKTEGYGLSEKGIQICLEKKAQLIIAVDCGISAVESVAIARSANCDVIIIDHHQKGDALPNANVILHDTSTSATALAWFFCRDFLKARLLPVNTEHLSLVALSVICDMMPLIGLNRSFARHGLRELQDTSRPGLITLFGSAGIDLKTTKISTYHCGFVIGPRLNAMGRLESAMDSLRIICTKKLDRAKTLSDKLNTTNKLRQELTQSGVDHALKQFSKDSLPNIVVVASNNYDIGVIGLIASKLVETYHRPSLAISIGGELAKGSARSIAGVDITGVLKLFKDSHLLDVGGHSMAAGFSLNSNNIENFSNAIQSTFIDPLLFIKKPYFDCEISTSIVTKELYKKLQELEPFGLGNPTPTFKSHAQLSGFRRIGSSKQHLKFQVGVLEAIYFNVRDFDENSINNADIFYTITENDFNNKITLQLQIKSIQI